MCNCLDGYCRFYICCDGCSDWFHGRCVGIIAPEADKIDEYLCPNCGKDSALNQANMNKLSAQDYDNIRKLTSQLQVRISIHKNVQFQAKFLSSKCELYF